MGYLSLNPDDEPLRESNSPAFQSDWYFDGHRGKWLNIQRWLRSHVGQRWSDINSKWTKRKKSGCEEYLHGKLDNIRNLELNCTKSSDGKVYNSKGDEVIRGLVVVDDVLYEVKDSRSKWRPKSLEERRWDHGVVWKTGGVFALINSIWYELKLENITLSVNELPKKDIFLNEWILFQRSRSNLRQLLYGRDDLYCVAKQQLNKHKIKILNLREQEG